MKPLKEKKESSMFDFFIYLANINLAYKLTLKISNLIDAASNSIITTKIKDFKIASLQLNNILLALFLIEKTYNLTKKMTNSHRSGTEKVALIVSICSLLLLISQIIAPTIIHTYLLPLSLILYIDEHLLTPISAIGLTLSLYNSQKGSPTQTILTCITLITIITLFAAHIIMLIFAALQFVIPASVLTNSTYPLLTLLISLINISVMFSSSPNSLDSTLQAKNTAECFESIEMTTITHTNTKESNIIDSKSADNCTIQLSD